MKRAQSSDLALMQGSGTTKETKQDGGHYTGPSERLSRKLAIIPWHLFAASNSEGTNYFFSRLFSVLFNFPPAREQISVLNIVSVVT